MNPLLARFKTNNMWKANGFAWKVVCSRCASEKIISTNKAQRMPPDIVVKKFHQAGWYISRRETDDLCPNCSHTKTRPPIQPPPSDVYNGVLNALREFEKQQPRERNRYVHVMQVMMDVLCAAFINVGEVGMTDRVQFLKILAQLNEHLGGADFPNLPGESSFAPQSQPRANCCNGSKPWRDEC
jgi:hypothetical protein